MSHAYTPILVGIGSLLSEILLLLKTANFPIPTMDYSPRSSKNLIDRNRLNKFMHVGIDVTCMHINFGRHRLSAFGDTVGIDVTCIHANFGGHRLSAFGDIATFKNGQFSLSNHGL